MELSAGIAIAAGILTAAFLWDGNKHLTVTNYTFSHILLPKSFSGFRIVQISDLHNVKFGRGNQKLLNRVKMMKPDRIAITGDLLYAPSSNMENALDFVAGAVMLCPVYYVPGNHEAAMDIYPELKQRLQDTGVIILENSKSAVVRDGSMLKVAGITDPSFYADDEVTDKSEIVKELMEETAIEEDVFSILLAHRPEYFSVYADFGVELSLTGHAHGGQIRLPWVGGLYAPGQGVFPKYASGMHRLIDQYMIVSRGLGKSAFPFRIFNRPEIVCVELKSENRMD